MKTLDDLDLEILRLLVEDARRPYSEIADRVDVSAPTVSDRIDRLDELGVVKGFTVDIDRSTFTDGNDILIDVELKADADRLVAERFANAEQVEHVFRTADSRLLAIATVRFDQVRPLLEEAIDLELVDSYRIHILEDRLWSPAISTAELALSCAECENTVSSGGVSSRLGGELYHFCCPTCQSAFEARYAELSESV